MKNIDFNMAYDAIQQQEQSYGHDWQQDSENLEASGLYRAIADLVDPKKGEIVVDIGTGRGLQLMALTMKEPDSIIIGTERTRVNAIEAYQFLSDLGLGDYLAVLATSEMDVTSERKIFWKHHTEAIRNAMHSVRQAMQEKIMIIDDNILHPESLPILLEGKKIDAGILSMPGGSSARTLEWPFQAEMLDSKTSRQRVFDVSNQTRFAFYHFMSEHVRESGRIVVAERMLADPSIDPRMAISHLLGRHMKSLTKYWKPANGALLEADFANTNVALNPADTEKGPIQNGVHNESHNRYIGILRLDRTDVPFEEPALPRPVQA